MSKQGAALRRPGRTRPGARGFVRTGLVAALCALVGLGVALPASASSRADAPMEGGFRNGRADAVAQVAQIAPGVGSLSLAVGTGVSVAQVANDLAQASSQTADLGLIGSSLTAEQCDGGAPAVRQDQLPQPTVVDNRKGDSTAASDGLPVAGTALGGGRQEADATGTPSAHASVSSLSTDISPVLKIDGGRSDATARIVDGDAREAEATVSMDIDLAGVVKLSGLRWDAVHRTGDGANFGGSFLIGAASANGLPLPTDQAGTLSELLNTALAPSGISIDLPQVQHLTSPNELVRVTPLTITLKDSPAGKTLLGPGLNLSRAQREQLFDAVVGVYCRTASLLLVGDIGVDVVSGTGFLVVQLGGAEAGTADVDYGDPFGSHPPAAASGEPVVEGTATTPVAAPPVAAPVARPTPVVEAAHNLPAAATAPLEAVCESVHPNRAPGCSKGLGVPLGVAALGATVLVGYLDWRRQRAFAAASGATPAGAA